jgi:hypothetical protein
MKQPSRTATQLSITESGDVEDGATVPAIDIWRHFVRDRLTFLEQAVNLYAHRKIRLLLQEVWARSDALTRDPQLSSAEHLHWIDVMEEKGLQFFL